MLADWRQTYGPLSLPMPTDAPPTLADFAAAEANHQRLEHEDAEDCLNEDGSHGPPDVGAVGGSGISFGYSCSDLTAVRVLERAVVRRKQRYDGEHHIRNIRYSIAAWEMTHEPLYARRLAWWDSIATGVMTDDPSTIHLNDPGWVPDTLAQFNAMAAQNPGRALPWNGRWIGWVAYGRAMRHKVDQRVSSKWGFTFLDTCSFAAILRTGQLIADTKYGTFPIPVQYTFHWGILAHGAMAMCHQFKKPAPAWVLAGMKSILHLPVWDYGGSPSMPSYCYTKKGELVPIEHPLQGPDPAHGWWSSNCVALAKLGHPEWLDVATKFGPTDAGSEQAKKESMLWRGWMSQ